MGTKAKKIVAACGIAAMIVVLAIVVVSSLDINSYKSRIEAAASGASGFDVKIDGKIGLSLFPFGVSAKNIHVAGNGGDILSLDELRIGAELMPLLKKHLKITSCDLVKPSITIVRGAAGTYNFESSKKEQKKDRAGAAFSLNDLRLTDGTFSYLDKKTGEKTEIKDFNFVVKDISIGDTASGIVNNISFRGDFYCKEVFQKKLEIDNVKAKVRAEKGVFYFMPLTMDVFGAKAEGNVAADESAAEAIYKINVKIPKLDFDKLQASFGTKKAISGKSDLVASLTIREKRGHSMLSSTNGTLSVVGENLVIDTMDIDKVLTSLEASQKFNLVDLGAFFIAGPLGNLAVQGYHYGDVYNQTRGGHGTITKLVSHWKISHGVAEASDCAFATRHHRVALKGRLDLVRERYDNFVVALLDEKGCAKVKQSINGPFSSPQVGALSVVESLASPVVNLFKAAKGLVHGGKCEVFYDGAVRP